VQYVFLWASGAPNSRAAPGSSHSSYATVSDVIFLLTAPKKSVQSKNLFICRSSFSNQTCGSTIVYFNLQPVQQDAAISVMQCPGDTRQFTHAWQKQLVFLLLSRLLMPLNAPPHTLNPLKMGFVGAVGWNA